VHPTGEQHPMMLPPLPVGEGFRSGNTAPQAHTQISSSKQPPRCLRISSTGKMARCNLTMSSCRDESGTDIIRPTERFRHSYGKTIFESGHLISITICTALVFGNSKLDFYDPNMMNVTIRQKIYCLYPYSIREFCPKKKNYLYLYPQYPSVSDLFSSLSSWHRMDIP
jgi:hypothetical protein